MYHMREMGLSDFTTAVNTAIEKAELRIKLEDARNALRVGVPVELVSTFTGLDIDLIRSLQ